MRYRTPSRRDEGFDIYLNRTKEQHNTFGFREFDIFVSISINKKNLMRLMNIKTYETMDAWLIDYWDFKKQQNGVQ